MQAVLRRGLVASRWLLLPFRSVGGASVAALFLCSVGKSHVVGSCAAA